MQTRLKVMRGHLVSGVSAGIIQVRVPEFHAKKFPPVANKVFSDFLKAHREGDLSTLAGVATEDMFASIKAEIKSSKNKGKGRTAYQLLGHTDHTLVLQMRHYVRNKLRMKEGWGQVRQFCSCLFLGAYISMFPHLSEMSFFLCPNCFLWSCHPQY
ncbi:unnamed protein product [Choristocarpus tenellus]